MEENMSIESILKEYLNRYGVQDVQFNPQGMFSAELEQLGTFSCEQTQDGILIALFQDIVPSERARFMERALQSTNPIENTSPFSIRPVLQETQCGMVAPIQKQDITLPTLSTLTDILFRNLQNAIRV